MRNEWKISALWFAGGIISWGIDVIADPCFRQMPFKTLFWCGSSNHDLFMRSYILGAFFLFGIASYFLVSRHSATHDALHEANGRIAELTVNNRLSGIVPICSYCKRIREGSGQWTKLETFIEKNSKAEFSHGICPECEKKL